MIDVAKENELSFYSDSSVNEIHAILGSYMVVLLNQRVLFFYFSVAVVVFMRVL